MTIAEPLVACPFCGRREGYKLAEGDTYRWWLVQCKACGAGVAECHSDRRTQAGTDLPQTWAAAHEAWNEAGKHANELRCAMTRCIENLERWLRTDVAASQEESRAIYEQMCAALGREPIDPNALTDEEAAVGPLPPRRGRRARALRESVRRNRGRPPARGRPGGRCQRAPARPTGA